LRFVGTWMTRPAPCVTLPSSEAGSRWRVHHGKDAKKKPQMSLKEKREAKRQKADLKNGGAMK